MRLRCPNCDAQYEVGDGVIPDGGRDVQCSNCGHTWFQYPHGHDDRPEEEVAPPKAPPPEPEIVIKDEEPEEAEFEASLQAALGGWDGDQEDDVEEGPQGPSGQSTQVTQASANTSAPAEIDPGIKAMLQEEATREMEARRAEVTPAIETQSDLGLDHGTPDTAALAAAAAATVARAAADDTTPETEVGGGRSALLPDIEDINASLRATSERDGEPDAPVSDDLEDIRAHRGGFRVGFILMLFVAVSAFLIYVFAPQIAEAFPQAKPILDRYVEAVNQLRLQLDGLVQELITWLRSLTA